MSFSRGLISVISSSGSIWDKSSWRGSFIFVFCGAMASFFSISLLVIATAADHWMDITVDREAVVGNLPPVLDSNQVRYYTRTSGLFRTCFPALSRPTAGVYLSLVGEWCTTNPPWTPPSISSNSTSSFTSPLSHSRLQLQWATPLLLLVSVTTLSVSFLVFVSYSCSKSSTRLVVAAVFQLLGAAVAATAMAAWHAAWFLHDIEIHADGSAWPDTQTSLGWSYFVAWAGIALSLIASLASGSAALARRKRTKMCHEDHDRTELSHNCSSSCHSTSINRNMPPCPGQTPRHSMLSCHSRPSSHGTCHRRPSSHGTCHSMPSSHGTCHSRPSSHGTCHSRPSSHGTCHSRPSSHGTCHSRPSSHGTCHSRPSSHGTCHSRPSSHGTCHSMPSSHGTTLCHHKLSDEMSLGCNRDGHSLMPRSCSCLGRERIPYQTNDRSVKIYGQGCDCSGNLSCGRSTSDTSSSMQKCGRIQGCECSGNQTCDTSSSMQKCGRIQDCECSGNLSRGGSTSETSSSRQKIIKWTGNPGEEINEMNGILTSRGSQNHQRLINHTKRFVEKGSYEAGEAVDGQIGEQYGIRIDESFVEDDRNSYVRVDETFAKESDNFGSQSEELSEDWDTSRVTVEHYDKKIDRYNKIPHSKEWDTSRIERYNKIPNSEDLDTCRIERYNKIPDSEDLDTSRIERYNKIPDSEDLDASRIERYNKIPHGEDWDTTRIKCYNKKLDCEDLDTSRIERYNKIPDSKDLDTSRIERYNKIQDSKDWDSSRIERYNKKMLHILKNTIMHSSDKYIREMLEF